MSHILEDVKRRLPLPLIFAVVCAVLATLLFRQHFKQKERALEAERTKIMANYQAPIDLVAAAKDIPQGTKLELLHLKKVTIPERFVQPYATRSPNDVVGKVTVAPMAEGEQILANKLRRADEAPAGSTLSSVMPKGKRAVTIAVDTMTGVGGFVRPTDIVDVLWTLKLPPQPGQKDGEFVTLTLFQDVPVLAVGADVEGVPGGDRKAAVRQKGEKAGEAAGSGSLYTVTLALPPQETSFLLFAREQGRIQLALRPRAESESQVAVVPANFNTLMEKVLGVRPVIQKPEEASAKPPREVEVYKGLKREVMVLSDQE